MSQNPLRVCSHWQKPSPGLIKKCVVWDCVEVFILTETDSDRCQWVSNPFHQSRSRSLSVWMHHKGPSFADMTSVPPMECPTQMIGRSPTPAARSLRTISAPRMRRDRLENNISYFKPCLNKETKKVKWPSYDLQKKYLVLTLMYVGMCSWNAHLSLSWGHFGAHSDRCVSYSTVSTRVWGQSWGNQSYTNTKDIVQSELVFKVRL